MMRIDEIQNKAFLLLEKGAYDAGWEMVTMILKKEKTNEKF